MAPKKRRRGAAHKKVGEEEVLEEEEVPEGKPEKARRRRGSKAEGGEMHLAGSGRPEVLREPPSQTDPWHCF